MAGRAWASTPARSAGGPKTHKADRTEDLVMELAMNRSKALLGLFGMVGAVALAGAGLGGCAAKEQRNEAEELRMQNTQLMSERDELGSKLELASGEVRQAQAERDAARREAEEAQRRARELAQSQPPAPMFTPPAPGPGPSSAPASRPDSGNDDVVITVAGDVLFGPGSATLSAGGKRELDQVARTIRSRYASNRIRVEGYTDSDPIRRSKWASNRELSQARAEAVENYLISKGISGSRISSRGMGSANPKGTKAASRRVEIVIIGR
jgi:outer membrane protein OmpA-like peptidoglycan-associated protein